MDVSTDYLLRDEIEEEEKNPATDEKVADETGEKLVPVSMELANDYLAHCQRASVPTAFGVFLCIMSPVFLLLLAGAGEAGLIPLTEDQGALLGTTILILLIVAAVSIFVINGHYDEKYEFLEKEALDTAYGVDGMVRDRKQKIREKSCEEADRWRGAVRGLLHPHFPDDPSVRGRKCDGADRGNSTASVLVATGVFLIVHTCIVWDGYQVLLEEGDYTRIAKKQNKRISGIYWGCVTAVYLLVSFLTMEWRITWVIWPVAGDRVGCSQQHLPEPGRAVTFKILAGGATPLRIFLFLFPSCTKTESMVNLFYLRRLAYRHMIRRRQRIW